MLALLIHLKHG